MRWGRWAWSDGVDGLNCGSESSVRVFSQGTDGLGAMGSMGLERWGRWAWSDEVDGLGAMGSMSLERWGR